MKPSTLKTFLLVVAGLFYTLAWSQRAEQPDYRYDIGGKIHNMTLTQGGTMVLATNDGLVGVKPGKDELLFNFQDYGRVKPEEVAFIPNAPYLVVGQTGFGAMTTKKAVIDYMSGQTLFSTEKNGWKMIMTCDVMMPQNNACAPRSAAAPSPATNRSLLHTTLKIKMTWFHLQLYG